MRKSVCRILWTLPVLTMLLVNNSVLFAQSTEETTTIIQSEQNLLKPQENNDPQSKATVTVFYLTLKSITPMDLYNSNSNATDYVYLKDNKGITIWGPVAVSVSNFYEINKTIPVSSTSTIELVEKNRNKSLGKLKIKDISKYVGQGEQQNSTAYRQGWSFNPATWKYNLSYELKSTQ